MEILVRETPQQAYAFAAAIIASRLQAKPDLVFGCATGRTMERIYAELVDMHHKTGLSFSNCRTFNLDEYVGLRPEDPRSYHAYMAKHLFELVDIDSSNTYLPHGYAEDLKVAAHDYEAHIQAAGGIDLQLLGLGKTGHIGFNEPASSLMSRTRDKLLTPTTLEQNAFMFGQDPAKVPKRAITMGVGTIIEADEILLVATGSEKAEVLAKATEGPVTAMISASALQLHPNCKVVADEAAVTCLKEIAYYRWVFEHEPEWQEYR